MPRTRTYGLDIDTIRYAQRVKSGSGTTILPEPLKQINKFVIGVKKLGLWNSMVCWPMRSIHNAGTGSTVYSLGGLQISNGTIVNSPTWGDKGIKFGDNSNRHMTTGITPALNSNYNVFAAMECLPQSVAFNVVVSTRNGSTGGFVFAQQWNGTWNNIPFVSSGTWANLTSTSITDGTYNTASFRVNCTPTHVVGLSINSSAEQTSTGTNVVQIAHSPMIIGNQDSAGPRSFDGNLAFTSYIVTPTIPINLLHILYKKSLGTGLNIP